MVGGSPRRAALGQEKHPVRRAASLRGFAFQNNNRSQPCYPRPSFPRPRSWARGRGKDVLYEPVSARKSQRVLATGTRTQGG
jgi:hypothetical protein